MSSRPRSRPAPGAMALGAALLVVVVLAALVIALRIDVRAGLQGLLDSMFPPPAATSQAQEIRNLYDIVFYFAAISTAVSALRGTGPGYSYSAGFTARSLSRAFPRKYEIGPVP